MSHSCRGQQEGTNVSPQAPVDHRQGFEIKRSLDRYLHRSAGRPCPGETFELQKGCWRPTTTRSGIGVRKWHPHRAQPIPNGGTGGRYFWLKGGQGAHQCRAVDHRELRAAHQSPYRPAHIGSTVACANSPDRVVALPRRIAGRSVAPLARKVLVIPQVVAESVALFPSSPLTRGYQGVCSARQISASSLTLPTPTQRLPGPRTATDNPKQRALFLILAFTGLRASEPRGLRWSDIDFASCELHVRQRADEYGVIRTAQVRRRVRTIPIDPGVDAACSSGNGRCNAPPGELRSRQQPANRWITKSIMDRNFTPLVKAAGIVDQSGEPKYTPHALRHFFASWCINPKARGGRGLAAEASAVSVGTLLHNDDLRHLRPSFSRSEGKPG